MQDEPTRPPEPEHEPQHQWKIDALYQVRGPLAEATLYSDRGVAESIAYDLWEKSGKDHYVHVIRTSEGRHT